MTNQPLQAEGDAFCRAHAMYWTQRIVMNHAALFSEKNTPSWRHFFCPFEYFGLTQQREDFDDAMPDAQRKALKTIVEAPVPELTVQSTVSVNIDLLTQRLGLTSEERLILVFAATLAFEAPILRAINDIEIASHNNLLQKISLILEVSVRSLRDALSSSGTLIRLGLLPDRSESGRFSDIESTFLLPRDVADVLANRHTNENDLFHHFAAPAIGTPLSKDDYPHLSRHTSIIIRYLQSAWRQPGKTQGINILLYGVPGSGKTEYAKMLAQELGVRLYQIGFANGSRESWSGGSRLSAYQMAQEYLASEQAIVLFDEAEDVFIDVGLLKLSNEELSYGKAWMNALIESNPVPTIWITNSIENMDPAYRRRFSLSIRMSTLPVSIRRTILQRHLNNFKLDHGLIEKMAQSNAVLPYHASRFEQILANIHHSTEDVQDDADLLYKENARLLDSTADLCIAPPIPFCLDACSITASSQLELKRLMTRSSLDAAHILLIGRLGSGKSALAQYLSEHFDRPLLERSPPYILNIVQGDTVRAIAGSFMVAKCSNEVLFFDRADHWLAARPDTLTGVQATVDEMKEQLCCRQVPVIVSIENREALPAVLLECFDYQIEFEPLQSDRLKSLFEASFGAETMASNVLVISALKSLKNIIPGDVVEALHRIEAAGQPRTPRALIDQLRMTERLRN